MEQRFHVSRRTAQLVRRRLPYCENAAYPTSWYPKSEKGRQRKDQASVSGRMIVADGICNDRSVQTNEALHHILSQGVRISSQSPTELKNFKLGATPKDWKTRQYTHSPRLDRNKVVSDQLSRRSLRSGLRYHLPYMPFSQASFTSSICGLPPAGRCSGRHFSVSAASPALLENHQSLLNRDDLHPFQPHEPGAKEPKIRERLRLWEAEYRSQQNSAFHQYDTLPSNIALAKHDQAEVFDEGAECDFEDIHYPTYERGDIVDLDSQRPYLLRGDMVELRASNCFRIELAIFVQVIGSQYQYYTMSGKWIHQKPRLARYCVPGFVDAHELDPLLEFLPSKSVPEALQHKLQSFEHALPRDVGSPLIKKMLDFWRESDRIYRDGAFNLGNAHKAVAHRFNMRYASLSDLAHRLLPKNYVKDGQFPSPVLYALHRSLMLDELGFRPQKWNHRITNRFEIIPVSEIELNRTVGDEIRMYYESLTDSGGGVQKVKNDSTVPLLQFLKKARHKIHESRGARKYTPHGMIGPAERRLGGEANAEEISGASKDTDYSFNSLDWRYIKFIASWAALRMVPNSSYLHGIASALLRATGMYHDTLLDQRVGWTFLQEVGVIAPWENRTHFDMRLPFAISCITPPKELHKAKEPKQLKTDLDVLDGLRKDWGSLPVYCIDDIGASEIDDGVSIEPADMADEYWIHVHVADPASMIEPQSVVAKNAITAMRTIYLPDRVISMLPSDVVQQHLSLAPDRRCLTFSGRINLNGKLLETKVTPGVLHNIIYMTPATLSTVMGETPRVHETVIMVGDNAATPPKKSPRQVVESHEITEVDVRNLKLLHALGKIRQSLSSARGGLMVDSPSFQIAVGTIGDSEEHEKGSDYIRHCWDPPIMLKVKKQAQTENSTYGNTVMSLMLLAGEVGARWCQERGIPVINRVSQPHPDDPNPKEYFRRVIKPLINNSKEPHGEARNFTGEIKESEESPGERTGSSQSQEEDVIALHFSEASKTLPLNIALEYQRLLGAVAPSTTPGPHLHLGLDIFTRTTSPLRRYSDLLAHWQIEAALLEEARLGESLIGSTREDYLPFKRDELDNFIPIFECCERELNRHQQDAQRVWAIQLLLRAWKFNQALLPATFDLWTHSFDSKTIRGDLTYFGDLSAAFERPNWLREDDIQVGDVFEVKLTDLDVYNRRIEVKPLRRVRRTTERAI